MNEVIAELYIYAMRLEEWHHEAYLTIQELGGPDLPGGLVELHRWDVELNKHKPLEEERSTGAREAFHRLYQSTIGCIPV